MPRAVDPEERRREISNAVFTLAIERGFGEVTIRAVAAELGASTTVVTHYFASRDEMIAATLRHELEAFMRAIDAELAGRDGAAAIRALVAFAVFDAPAQLRDFWMATVIDASREATVRAEARRFDALWDARLDALVSQLHSPRHKTRADQIDLVISGAIMLGAEGVAESARRRTVDSMLDLILDS